MRNFKRPLLCLLLASFAIGVLTFAGPSSTRTAEPYRPTDDTQVVLQLPQLESAEGPRHPLAEIRRRRAKLEQQPNDLVAALEFAHFALDIGRREGDPRYYGYVEGALEPWWQRRMPPLEVLLLRATLAQHRHQFQSALADLELVLRQRPRWAQAWMSRAVILAVQGNLQEALASCQPLRRLSSPLLATACSSHVEGLGLRADDAYRSLLEVVEATPQGTTEERLWALVTLAEIAHRRGNSVAAQQHFLAARDLDSRDLYSLIAYAEFLLDEHRPQDVEHLLRDETQRTSLLLRLTLAEQELGSPRLEEHRAALKRRYAAGEQRQERLHLAEEARFALDLQGRPEYALQLAETNWQLQREPIDGRILLRAALANGTPERALPVIEQVRRNGLQDVRINAWIDQLEEDAR